MCSFPVFPFWAAMQGRTDSTVYKATLYTLQCLSERLLYRQHPLGCTQLSILWTYTLCLLENSELEMTVCCLTNKLSLLVYVGNILVLRVAFKETHTHTTAYTSHRVSHCIRYKITQTCIVFYSPISLASSCPTSSLPVLRTHLCSPISRSGLCPPGHKTMLLPLPLLPTLTLQLPV